jgi:hypothetical protein
MAFHNVDVLIYIASFIHDKMLLPFVLTSKSCLEATIASHRNFYISSLSYFSGRVQMANWVVDIHPQRITKLIKLAAHNGALDVIIHLREREPNLSSDIDLLCSTASLNGHLHVLQWLRSQDPPCPWGSDTCARAARNAHLHVLQWLRSQDPPCPWGDTCDYAARNGHLHVLQWLRSQDPPCPWGSNNVPVQL